jgi:ubiquinone/menaquinone biosynthesis C-methylase UbiE
VNSSLWEYVTTPRLAAEEDAYFAGHALFEADAAAIDARFRPPGRLVDLGCGSGRHSVRLAVRGFEVTAVDLSQPMLKVVDQKAFDQGVRIATVQANLCRLTCFPDASFDLAISMFSTLGMIRGASARQSALNEAARILRPGGRLAIHAHNLFLNLRNSQGRRWLLQQAWKALRLQPGVGDRIMTYRGIPRMEVHLYRWGELKRSLVKAGFRIDESIPLDEISSSPIERPRMLPSLRAGGWLVFASKR